MSIRAEEGNETRGVYYIGVVALLMYMLVLITDTLLHTTLDACHYGTSMLSRRRFTTNPSVHIPAAVDTRLMGCKVCPLVSPPPPRPRRCSPPFKLSLMLIVSCLFPPPLLSLHLLLLLLAHLGLGRCALPQA